MLNGNDILGNSIVKHRNSLNKKERLNSKKLIDTLFNAGFSHRIGCIRLIYMHVENATLPQVLFSVPKSKIPRAHIRNAIKRKMRESYRLHKYIICDSHALKIVIGLLYIKNCNNSFSVICNDVVAHLERLGERYKSLSESIYINS